MSTAETKRLIDEVMSRFDFARVHAVMTLVHWQWQNKNVRIQDLKRTARELLLGAAASPHDHGCHMTGGFKAEKFVGEDGTALSLSFVLEDATAE
jgi:hypothetical protein